MVVEVEVQDAMERRRHQRAVAAVAYAARCHNRAGGFVADVSVAENLQEQYMNHRILRECWDWSASQLSTFSFYRSSSLNTCKILTTISRDSVADIRKRVRRHEALLREIAANTRYLRRSRAVQAPESILSPDDERESVFSQVIASKNVKPSFETVILGTQVYSNAFAGAIGPVDDDGSDDARTVVNAPSQEIPLANALAGMPEPSKLAIHAPSIQSAIKGLDVADIIARAQVACESARKDELSHKEVEQIKDIQKITENRYYGSILRGSEKSFGHFERDTVMMCFILRKPLTIATSSVFTFTDGLYTTLSLSGTLRVSVSWMASYCA